ncbi:Ldh family oxidoreductase [Aestuariivirga sp.]|uniref:Ldh family oxidoreductase n=1 Tax=Aestuariivirga sp. TaxID=2650926 RepID=UPI0039E59D06
MRISLEALETSIRDLFLTNGAGETQAASVARHMAWCESVGRANFGIERIPILIKRMRQGVLDGQSEMAFESLAPSISRLDAAGGFGFDAAERAMGRAVELAKATGIGVVGVKDSNFSGCGAYYVSRAADEGMISLALSNSFPKVVAHGGIKPVLGTNPFAFGAPARNGRHLLFDMATSALAGSTVREHIAKGISLPEGLAIDTNGNPVTDPSKVADGALLPFGGAKGYGLSLLVEILSGVLTGAGIGPGVASMYSDFSRSGSNGQFLLALDISRWMDRDNYFDRFETLTALLRASGDGVLFPGEIRWEHRQRALTDGVEIDDRRWQEIQNLNPAP